MCSQLHGNTFRFTRLCAWAKGVLHFSIPRRGNEKNNYAPRTPHPALAFLAALLLVLGAPHQSQVSAAPLSATAGPNYAGTATSATWSSPSNATGSPDNNCAISTAPSVTIDLTAFGFSIPAGSTITGILVEPKIGQFVVASSISAQLLKGGSPTGSSKTLSSTSVGGVCSLTVFGSMGGTGDTWGASLTSSDANASNFGVRITGSTNNSTHLDAVRITVFYDPGAADVPEANTLLLFGGGLGGLATWLGWQKSKLRARQNKN
ncbi:MAG: hypothetical protein HY257_04975 [Chloroflexi bacterium]|nr:hypothetical protein [Chloroflexota bacterium]